MERAQSAQRILAWLVLLGATAQFFLAGLAVFRARPHDSDKLFESSSFDVHRGLGYALVLLSFALLVLAIVNRERVRLAFVLFVLMLLQVGLAMAGHDAAAVGGLHALNGLIVLLFSHLLTRGPREREEPESYEEPLPAE